MQLEFKYKNGFFYNILINITAFLLKVLLNKEAYKIVIYWFNVGIDVKTCIIDVKAYMFNIFYCIR